MSDYDVVWRMDASEAAKTNTARFMRRHGFGTYGELAERSTTDPEWFWRAVTDFLDLRFDPPYTVVRDTSRGHPWATWFVDGGFNLSEACVDRWAADSPDRAAVRSLKESGESRELTYAELTYAELLDRVGRVAGALRRLGVGRGDAVALYLPMSEEAVVALLATARLGAIVVPIFSGFGAEAAAERLADPKPRVLICANGYRRRGKTIEMKKTVDRALDIAGGVPNVLVVDYAAAGFTPMTEGRDVWWHEIVPASDPVGAPCTRAEDPVLVAFTSGTTGRPKGAVHVQGGFTVKVAQEGAFQLDIRREDTLMWASDMGWIMGPWTVVAGLANGATIAVFDGVPDYPGPDRIWEAVEKLGVTLFGLSPALVRSLQPHGAGQARKHDLSRVRAFASTGEPWNPGPWWWLFRDVGEGRIPILNLSGGTEIGACILSANLLQGIKPTSVGGPSLGVDADVYSEAGEPLRGEVGELVMRGSWPGMTRGFWGEPERYINTYWSRFAGAWVHGDWASIDEDGFWYLLGRSDDTLNVASKRVGPTEIESAAMSLDEVVMAAAVGVPDEVKGEAIALFLVAAADAAPGDDLSAAVVAAIDESMGAAFRPKAIQWVADLPRTRSQKIIRRLVKSVALGEAPGDLSGLENPESLETIHPLP